MSDLTLTWQIGLEAAASRLAAGEPVALVGGSETLRREAAALLDVVEPSLDTRRWLWLAEPSTAPPTLAPGALAVVLAPGGLAWLFDRLRGVSPRPPFDLGQVCRRANYDLSLHRGIGSPASILYAGLVRAAERAARPDMVDRFELAYRRSLAPNRHPERADLQIAELRWRS